ncbi:hypothetical protein NPIL_320221, partial [Nephila pilipes]
NRRTFRNDGEKNFAADSLKDSVIRSMKSSMLKTHGTGTIIGDQIEVDSLTDVFTKTEETLLIEDS